MTTLRVFISYSHDSTEHQERVLNLSDRLRTDGIECLIDQYEVSPAEGWPRWMARRIREADFVLVVCTETYLRRFNGDEKPGVGHGVRWESMLTSQDIYDRGSLNTKFVPVVFERGDTQFIPTPLGGASYFRLDTDEGYEQLFRRLLNIPTAEKPPLGKLKAVAVRERQAEFFTPAIDVALAKLPSTGPDLFGRDAELKMLDDAWGDGKTNVVTLVAFGGVGKTALVNVWLGHMQQDQFRGARRVYGWSFYSQGTSEDKQASGDEFLAAALKWFGDEDPTQGSPWDKGERLARLARKERTLLILDGLEPLQYPPGEQTGRLRDPGVQSLLRELAVDNPGLCVVSTRLAVDDFKGFTETTVHRMDLEDLSAEAGAQLLKQLGVRGTDDELKETTKDFDGHALALTLLGNYLRIVHAGDVRKRGEVPRLTADQRQGGHARRVMECYERWYAGKPRFRFLPFWRTRNKPELSILRMMGLFDRPAVGGAIGALRAEPPVADLTADLHGLSEADWRFALQNLRDVRLLAEADANASDTLDCHPLIREHFGDRLRSEYPEAWREGHNRLYEYFKGPGCTKEFPDTIDEMVPLYAAVIHGCHAGRHQEALDDVYKRRIQRGHQAFNTKMLGAIGAELAALSAFFDPPWSHPVETLTEADRGHVLSEAGFDLRALGRLREAVHPMQAALEAAVGQEDCQNAAIRASNLSELFLTLGEISHALDYAQQSVELAGQSGDPGQRMLRRTTLAASLHQAGRFPEAEAAFREAEQMQEEDQPEYPILYSLQGFLYCGLLLDLGNYRDVSKRATQALDWTTGGLSLSLLSVALDHLSLGRARLMAVQREGSSDFAEAEDHLCQAVDSLRTAERQDHLPRGLLARVEYYRVRGEREGEGEFFDDARRDLDEAMIIATRSEMRLHEADAHLEYARLHLAMGDKDAARASLKAAKEIVEQTGYHRRDAAVAELEKALAS